MIPRIERHVRLRVLAGLQCCGRRRRLHGAGLLLGEARTAATPPGIEFRAEAVHRAEPVVHVTMHRHPLALFPALDGTNIAFCKTGNFFPGIKGDRRGLVGRLWR